MRKRLWFLTLGILCLGTSGFLTYGLQFVTSNTNWYLGYMVFAFAVGLGCIYYVLKPGK